MSPFTLTITVVSRDAWYRGHLGKVHGATVETSVECHRRLFASLYENPFAFTKDAPKVQPVDISQVYPK